MEEKRKPQQPHISARYCTVNRFRIGKKFSMLQLLLAVERNGELHRRMGKVRLEMQSDEFIAGMWDQIVEMANGQLDGVELLSTDEFDSLFSGEEG